MQSYLPERSCRNIACRLSAKISCCASWSSSSISIKFVLSRGIRSLYGMARCFLERFLRHIVSFNIVLFCLILYSYPVIWFYYLHNHPTPRRRERNNYELKKRVRYFGLRFPFVLADFGSLTRLPSSEEGRVGRYPPKIRGPRLNFVLDIFI